MMRKLRSLITVSLITVSLGWLLEDTLLYHHSIWRLANAAEESEVVECDEQIQALSGKVGISCFVDTYNDTTKPNRVRRAAATALMKADATLAETLFKQHLDSTNPDVSGMAIRDLGAIGSKTYRNEILQKTSSPNEIVRWSVVDYLGHFQDAESSEILEGIRDSDSSDMIRNAATDRLERSSIKTGN
jgi:HEAT repeat protein